MKYILMNKNKKIMLLEYNLYNVISKIYEIYNIEYAPLFVFTNFENRNSDLTKTLNIWFTKKIPNERKNLEKLLDKLGFDYCNYEVEWSDKRKEKLVSGLDKRITKLSEFIGNISK